MTHYKGVKFRHSNSTLAEWWASLEIKQPPVVQVCCGGWFASTGARLKSRDSTFWAAMAQSLDYGEYSIIEGHYAERSWASLLREPVSDALIKELDAFATSARAAAVRHPFQFSWYSYGHVVNSTVL